MAVIRLNEGKPNFLQVVENEYVTTVCLPWWDEEEDYMRYKLTKIIRKTFLNTIFNKTVIISNLISGFDGVEAPVVVAGWGATTRRGGR